MGCTCEYTCSNLQREITSARGKAGERGARRTGRESGIETCAARVTKVEGAEGRRCYMEIATDVIGDGFCNKQQRGNERSNKREARRYRVQ
jgi:hypothetical protein